MVSGAGTWRGLSAPTGGEASMCGMHAADLVKVDGQDYRHVPRRVAEDAPL
jgi:hypothetical protein